MPDVVVDAPAASAALDRGRAETDTVADSAKGQAPQSNDPKVADALRALSDRTGEDADRAGAHAQDGSAAATALNEADQESAAAAAALPTGGGAPSGASRASTVTVAPAQVAAGQQQAQQMAAQQMAAQQQMASQQAQQQMMAAAAQQQQMTAMAQQAAMAMSAPAAAMAAAPAGLAGMPAGTILVDPNDLASLIDSVDGEGGSLGSSGGSSSWNGSTSPDPLDVGQVEYEKTHGVLSREQMSAVVDSAMDKTGIENPEARAKWKNVLLYMAEEEASNNASAVNNWDSNAVGPTQVDGSPAQSSRGPWQTIPSTFAAHHAAGTSMNIYDPEASAGAAINYMKDRYNIGEDGSGLDEFYAARAHGRYVGY